MILRELWGTCLLPIPAPHRHVAWENQGAFLCLLTNWWIPESAIVVRASPDEWDAPSTPGTRGRAKTPPQPAIANGRTQAR